MVSKLKFIKLYILALKLSRGLIEWGIMNKNQSHTKLNHVAFHVATKVQLVHIKK